MFLLHLLALIDNKYARLEVIHYQSFEELNPLYKNLHYENTDGKSKI